MFWCTSAFSSSSVCVELISISFLLPSFSGKIEIHFLGWSHFIKAVLLWFSSPVKPKDNSRMGERLFFFFFFLLLTAQWFSFSFSKLVFSTVWPGYRGKTELNTGPFLLGYCECVRVRKSSMTGSMQVLTAATQALWGVDPELQFSGSSAQTPCCSLQYGKILFFF